jgi:hypothetical protein
MYNCTPLSHSFPPFSLSGLRREVTPLYTLPRPSKMEDCSFIIQKRINILFIPVFNILSIPKQLLIYCSFFSYSPRGHSPLSSSSFLAANCTLKLCAARIQATMMSCIDNLRKIRYYLI